MPANSYKHLFTVLTPNRVENMQTGVVALNHSPAFKIYGNIRAFPAPTEKTINQQVVQVGTHIVTARYDSRVTNDCQLSLNGKVFEIAGVDNVEFADDEMILTCIAFTKPQG